MNRLDAYNCKSDYYTIYPVDTTYIINNIDELHFNSILLNPELEIEEGILEFTNINRPLSIGYDYVFKNYLGINGKYFEDNKEIVFDLFRNISPKLSSSYLQVDEHLVDDEIIGLLKNNGNIKVLVIGKQKIK